MAAVTQSVATCSGLIHHPGHAKLPFGNMGTKITNHNAVSVTCGRTRRAGIRRLAVRRVGTTYAASVGKDHQQLSIDDGVPQEPFLLSLFKETVWSLRSLFVFLLEQPSQLKYIEWPGFRSTTCSIDRCYTCPVGYEGAPATRTEPFRSPAAPFRSIKSQAHAHSCGK